MGVIRGFDEYVDGVMDGSIVVGTCVKQAVERHIADVARESTPDFPYTFNRDTAAQAIEAFPVLFRHTVGKYAGTPFELSPWQAFVVGSIWGWKDADGNRKFRRAYVTLGRKNGKSTLAAGLAILMANFDNEPAAQCFIGASKIDQAKIIFEECKRMIGSSPHLRELADRRSLQINFDSTNSFIRPLGSDRAFDGLNPHLVLFDELHVWREQHRGFYDTLSTGSAARSQPLQFTITTAGSTSSNIWIEVEGLAKKVLDGSFEEESFFAYVAQIDWIKSMPNLGVSVDIDYIREQAREAAVSAVALNRFKRYFANMQVSPIEAAINLDKWDACGGEFSDWSDADCVTAGVDVGGRNDLAAIAFCARFPDGTDDDGNQAYRYEIKTKTFLDADSSRDLNEMPFMQFVQDKLLHIVPAVSQQMENDILKAMQGYRSKVVGLDPWNAQFLAERLEMAGMEPVMVQQNRFKLNEPCLLLLDLIEKRKLRHDGDRILRWCAGNLVFSIDTAGRVMPDKAESSEKIDAIVASIIALKLASLAPERPRGPLFVS
jgi:phage terminase large subunit-like protein